MILLTKRLAILSLSFLSFGMAGQDNPTTERTLPPFTKLKVSGNIAVELIPSNESKIVLQQEDTQHLRIEVEKDWLEIEPEEQELDEQELIVSQLKEDTYLKGYALDEDELEEIYEELAENVAEETADEITLLIQEVMEGVNEEIAEEIQKDSISLKKFGVKIEKIVAQIEKQVSQEAETSFWDKWFKSKNNYRNRDFSLTIYYTNLQHLILETGASLKSKKPIQNSDLILELETGASIASDLIAKNLVLELSTGSSAKIGGMVEKGEISTSTGSALKTNDLFVKRLQLDASTGSQIKINLSQPNEKIALDASTGSRISLNIKNTDNIMGNISTGSKVRLKGNAKQQGFNLNTSSSLDAEDLKTNITIIKAYHSSEASVYATQTLEATATHSSEISFGGNPKNKTIKEKYSGTITSN